jgi:hypothetical protein
MSEEENNQVLPIALGVGVILTTIIVYHLYKSSKTSKGRYGL